MMNTEKLLIANRGEIAVRIIHACRDMGISSVALYADDDIGSMHVELADEAWGLAGATASETYLNIPAIIEVAKNRKRRWCIRVMAFYLNVLSLPKP